MEIPLGTTSLKAFIIRTNYAMALTAGTWITVYLLFPESMERYSVTLSTFINLTKLILGNGDKIRF